MKGYATMTVKELLEKYDFYNYEKTRFESFAVYFPKGDLEKAKAFDIDFLEPVENCKDICKYQTGLQVLSYKIMESEELEKTIFKNEIWDDNDRLAFAFSKWICILAKPLLQSGLYV